MLLIILTLLNNDLYQSDTWLVIVNPNAGHRKGRKDWHLISKLLSDYQIKFRPFFTEGRKHAIEITDEGIQKGFRKIIIVGGDGTINEVVNGCFNQKVCPTTDLILSNITVGTGNDWGRMFGIPSDYEGAIKVIQECRIRQQDAGVVYYHCGNEREKRYFINIAGLGFDALVVQRTNRQKERGRNGKAVYLWNLLRSLIAYKHTYTDVIIDGNKISNHTFTISLGIGRYSGGGMMQTPKALPDDGLFDITIIKKMRRRDIIRNLKMLYDGTILKHPLIEGYTGKDICIDSDPIIHLETDGEALGHSPIEFRILPQSINIIYGKYPEWPDEKLN